MKIQHHCSRCGKLMAEERTRRSSANEKPKIRLREGADLVNDLGMAPRVKCACGLLHILVKGSL